MTYFIFKKRIFKGTQIKANWLCEFDDFKHIIQHVNVATYKYCTINI